MSRRPAKSLIELLVVLAIFAALVALGLPAVQSSRRRAVALQCQNNLNQLGLGVADYAATHKRLPGPGEPGKVGGWTTDILPFVEQKNLADRALKGSPLAAAPPELLRQPRIFRCPAREALDGAPPAGTMEPSHYLFHVDKARKVYDITDAPVTLVAPWAGSPEVLYGSLVSPVGPHSGGCLSTSGTTVSGR